MKTGRSCGSGSLTPGCALLDNGSPELTPPEAIPHRPRHEPSLTASPEQEQAPAAPPPAGATDSRGIPDTVLLVPAHPEPRQPQQPGD